jgi:hypothetical protein
LEGAGSEPGVNSKGRRYTNLSIPGTGFGYRTSGKGCAPVVMFIAGLGVAARLLLETTS